MEATKTKPLDLLDKHQLSQIREKNDFRNIFQSSFIVYIPSVMINNSFVIFGQIMDKGYCPYQKLTTAHQMRSNKS